MMIWDLILILLFCMAIMYFLNQVLTIFAIKRINDRIDRLERSLDEVETSGLSYFIDEEVNNDEL